MGDALQQTASEGKAAAVNPGTRAIPGAMLLLIIGGWLALDQLLLWRFIGWTSPLPYLAAIAALAAAARWLWQAGAALPAIPLNRWLLCIGFALVVYVVGGEGHILYTNLDWQVRDAVLRDMATQPWPFAYVTDRPEPDLLRAPLGMFLLPALAWKVGGIHLSDAALLMQNALLLGCVLALGSTLFDTARARGVALVVVTFFSGLDIVGRFIVGKPLASHLEFWFAIFQYSSHLTQAFWVPQHALAGWLIALLLLLWRRGYLTVGGLAAIAPLTLLWSPFALIGALPFIVWAGMQSLWRRQIVWRDIALPALTSVIALPSVVYLAAAPDGVGARLVEQPLLSWAVFVFLEAMIWCLALLLLARRSRHGRAFLIIATFILLVAPFGQIGWSIDFMMRATIPALAIIAVLVAEALTDQPTMLRRMILVSLLVIGSVTGTAEIWRAISFPIAPRGQCSFFGAWNVSFGHYPKGSYLAPLSQVPAAIRPDNPALYRVQDPRPCWPGRWQKPTGV